MCMNAKKVELEFKIDAYHKKLLKYNFTSNVNRSSQIPDGLEDEMFIPDFICDNLRYYMDAYDKASMIILNIIPATKYKQLLGESNSVKFILSYDKSNNHVEIKPDPSHKFGLKFTLQSMYIESSSLYQTTILNTVRSYLKILQSVINEKSSDISENNFIFNISICGDKFSITSCDGKNIECTRFSHSRVNINDCETFIIQTIEDEIDKMVSGIKSVDDNNVSTDAVNKTENDSHNVINSDDCCHKQKIEYKVDLNVKSDDNDNDINYDVFSCTKYDGKVTLYQPIVMFCRTKDGGIRIINLNLCDTEEEAKNIIDTYMYEIAVKLNNVSKSKVGYIIKDNGIIRIKDKIRVVKFGVKPITIDVDGDII